MSNYEQKKLNFTMTSKITCETLSLSFTITFTYNTQYADINILNGLKKISILAHLCQING